MSGTIFPHRRGAGRPGLTAGFTPWMGYAGPITTPTNAPTRMKQTRIPVPVISLPLLALAMLGVSLLPDRYPAAGLLWDFLNGLGFGALAVIVFLGWDSESPATHPRVRLHQHLATVGCLLMGGHVVGFLIADPLLLEYLKPTAPLSMLAGLAAAVAMLAVTVSAYPSLRRRCYGSFPRFRRWHRNTGIVLLGLAIWHVVGAGYSVGDEPGVSRTGAVRLALFLPLVAAVPLIAFYRRRTARFVPIGPPPPGNAAADRDALLVLLTLLLLASAWTAVKNF